MNAILDIIIVIIATITIFFAVKNGFVKTLLSASSFLIAIVVTVLLLSPVKNAFMQTSLADGVRDSVESKIDELLVKNGIGDVEELVEEDTQTNEFELFLDGLGINSKSLQTEFDDWKSETEVDLKENLVDYLSKPIVNAAVTIAAVLLLFFGSIILLKVTSYILDRIFKLPVLRTANKLLGLLLGIILAVVRIYLFCVLVKFLIPYGQALSVNALSNINPDNTLLFKLFYDFNIFDFLF